MVRLISEQEHATLQSAIKTVEAQTTVSLRVAMHPASALYQEFMLLYGLFWGSVLGLLLWFAGVLTSFPVLLAVQLVLMLVTVAVPFLRKLCLHLVPGAVLRRHAARAAFQDYYLHQAALTAEVPFVLLYISLAERYVHVITNPVVHQKIPDQWDLVTDEFAIAIRKDGLGAASVQAARHIGAMLSSFNDKRGGGMV